MKKVVARKVYDTDTAVLVGSVEMGNKMDGTWFRECLYRKESGEFFLYGEGMSESKYAHRLSVVQSTRGCRFCPIGPLEAYGWVDDHLIGDAYERAYQLLEAGAQVYDLSDVVPEDAPEPRVDGTCVASYLFGEPGDRTYRLERLYRMEDGTWRLFVTTGEKAYGPAPLDGYRIESYEVDRFSEERAREWAEERISAEMYELLFGKVEE